MTADGELRRVIIGMLGFAATEEQVLLATSHSADPGDASCWAAAPLVAHNSEFKAQQVHRLLAVSEGRTPDEFSQIDHGSPEVYSRYLARSPDDLAEESSRVSADLVTSLRQLSDADLDGRAANPWLNGRQLWLQIIVRGFWHATGHLTEYYLAHFQPDRAVALAAHGVTTAHYLSAPDPVRGMAGYNLACAYARTDQPDLAAVALEEAISLNPDLHANALRDPDFGALRSSGRLG